MIRREFLITILLMIYIISYTCTVINIMFNLLFNARIVFLFNIYFNKLYLFKNLIIKRFKIKIYITMLFI